MASDKRAVWDAEQVTRNQRYLLVRQATGGKTEFAATRLTELSEVIGREGRLTQEAFDAAIELGTKEAEAILNGGALPEVKYRGGETLDKHGHQVVGSYAVWAANKKAARAAAEAEKAAKLLAKAEAPAAEAAAAS